jgi:xylulokinase
MSLIGIDVGTSAVKVAAYREDGGLLASSREPVRPRRPRPGWEELNPEEVWRATCRGLGVVTASPALSTDPPRALAVSASGDEAFPVDREGTSLGPCILSGDMRGADIERKVADRAAASDWYSVCGHVPARMDPILRLLWWRTHRQGTLSQADRFVGWHEFLTLRLCGFAVIDRSLASKWLTYDLTARDWSPERLASFDIDPDFLSEIRPWGTQVGEVRPNLARKLGLPDRTAVGVGGYDSSCAALGSGASGAGTVGLACGSWEVAVAPTENRVVVDDLAETGLPLVPHPGRSPFAILAQSPNGAAVADWAAALLHMPLASTQSGLDASGPAPSPVLAVPHLSGAISPWKDARESRGALLGLTLATTSTEILKAFLEGVAYDLALTSEVLRGAGVSVEVLRAAGGGARSKWWMQLKADLTGTPVEVSGHQEPGTWGAALLAGSAIGVYESLGRASEEMRRTAHEFRPNEQRARLYVGRIAAYQEAVETLRPMYSQVT